VISFTPEFVATTSLIQVIAMADTPKRRAIPGFVFGKELLYFHTSVVVTDQQIDEARGRYFPILPGHKAPPNYNYTVDAVKKQDELQGVSFNSSLTRPSIVPATTIAKSTLCYRRNRK
jgi:hypothetical protein